MKTFRMKRSIWAPFGARKAGTKGRREHERMIAQKENYEMNGLSGVHGCSSSDVVYTVFVYALKSM